MTNNQTSLTVSLTSTDNSTTITTSRSTDVTDEFETRTPKFEYNNNHNAGIGLFSLIFLALSLTAITAMVRTKRIHYAARLISLLLLILDCLRLVTSSIRRFITDPVINTQMNIVGFLFHELNALTVAIISLERLFVFCWPMDYLYHVTPRRVQWTMLISWCSMVVLFYSLRFGICNLFYDISILLAMPRSCEGLLIAYHSSFLLCTYVTSIVCYVKIYIVVKQKKSTTGKGVWSGKSIQSTITKYKSTSFIAMNIFMMLLNTSVYAAIILLEKKVNIGIPESRVYYDELTILNCLINPILYVLWFKESRMELLKMFSGCNRAFKQRAERMRLDLFNIVTYTKHSNRISTITS